MIALGDLNVAALGFVRATVECGGRPDLQAGTVVEIEGAGTRFSGSYYVTAVTHIVDADGLPHDADGGEERHMTEPHFRRRTTRAPAPGPRDRRRHQQQGPRRPGPGQGRAALARRPLRDRLGAGREPDGRPGARALPAARGRRRGAGRVRARPARLPVRPRRAVERQGQAARRPTATARTTAGRSRRAAGTSSG